MSEKMKFLSRALSLCVSISLIGCGGGGGSGGGSSSSDSNILRDVNGDGKTTILAFGDSITEGTGDFPSDGLRGYPLRLQRILHIPVESLALGGENLAYEGLMRLIGTLPSSGSDFVVLDEGNSDALADVPIDQFKDALQQAVAQIIAANKVPILINQYPNCCRNGAGHAAQLEAVNQVIDEVAAAANVRVADVDRAWHSTCDKLPECFLINLPDGVHPTPAGYDVITQVVLATFAGIDIFARDGAQQLEQAFGLAPGSVIVKPDE